MESKKVAIEYSCNHARMTSGNTNEAIRAKLLSSIGVDISLDWLQACSLHLQQQEHNPVSLEMVLWQVLYSDLRDVVRDSESHKKGVAAQQLHDSLSKSRQQPYNNQTLPESFQLLCQLEEAVDVAKSTEQRVGNNNNASCKVCLSDGYDMIEGIETVSIPNLSPGTLAGSKILLKGPISARHGILLLTPANFIILGGCCDMLVQHQTKALAQKREGVGIDPTIRALVRNGMGEVEDNENDDEAFQESGDVTVQPRSPLAGRKRNVSQISNATTSRPQPQQSQQHNREQPQQYQQQIIRQQQQPRQQPQPSMPPPASLPRKSVNPYQRTSTAQEPAKRQRPSNSATGQDSSRIVPTQNSTIRNHSSNLQQQKQQQQQITQENPIQNTSNTTTLQQSPRASTTGMAKPPSSPHFLYSAPKTVVANVSKQNVQKMTYDNLRRLLLQLVNNRDMYESYYQQNIVFRVDLSVPDHTRYDFNVTKVPKSKQQKKLKKKYEYFTSALFGSSNTDVSMSCRIHPDLLESCFEVSANDLRALSRSDRPRCTAITNSGGEAVRSTYFGKREWQARLRRSTQEVFDEQSNGGKALLNDLKNPILMLQTIQ